jgi:quinol monooxygenase YgiN
MYIRVTRGRFGAENTDEAVRVARDQLVPGLRQRPGFRHYYAGLDHDARTLISISAWDTREQARAAQTAYGPFESLGIRFEAAEIFEVTVEV